MFTPEAANLGLMRSMDWSVLTKINMVMFVMTVTRKGRMHMFSVSFQMNVSILLQGI